MPGGSRLYVPVVLLRLCVPDDSVDECGAGESMVFWLMIAGEHAYSTALCVLMS